MAFGQKAGSIKGLKKSLKGGGAGFIKYVPKDESLTVRFITDPDEWLMYRETFDEATNRGYPVPDDKNAPGYPDPDQRTSKRYLANAVMVDDDKVVPLQMPVSLVNQLVVLYEKYGTVCDRDFELMRSGTGLDTSYQAVPEAPLKRKLDKYKPMDLEQVLEDAYNAIWGDDPNVEVDDDDEDEDEEDHVEVKRPVGTKKKAGKKAAPKKKKAQKVVEEIEDDEDEPDVDELEDEDIEEDDDIDDLAEEDEDEDEDDDDEDDDEADEEDDEDADFYTEADLKAMGIADLRALAREYGVTTKGMKKPQIIEALLSDDDDEDEESEPF